MKKTALVICLALAAAACGDSSVVNNKAETAPNKPASVNTVNQNTAANTVSNSTVRLKGEKLAAPITVKFGVEGIPAGWRWVDPDITNGPTKYDTASGTLKVTVPSGKDMFGENRTAPHLIKPIEGDFEIETRVKFAPKSDYQGAGLFVYKDAEHYIRLERAFGGVGGDGSGIRLDARTKDEYKPITTPDNAATEATTVDLKILRMGKTFIAFWRIDENGEWKEIGEFVSDYPDTVQVGLIACNTAAPITVEFSYIKLAPAV